VLFSLRSSLWFTYVNDADPSSVFYLNADPSFNIADPSLNIADPSSELFPTTVLVDELNNADPSSNIAEPSSAIKSFFNSIPRSQ